MQERPKELVCNRCVNSGSSGSNRLVLVLIITRSSACVSSGPCGCSGSCVRLVAGLAPMQKTLQAPNVPYHLRRLRLQSIGNDREACMIAQRV